MIILKCQTSRNDTVDMTILPPPFPPSQLVGWIIFSLKKIKISGNAPDSLKIYTADSHIQNTKIKYGN